jgi:hypothetical protein
MAGRQSRPSKHAVLTVAAPGAANRWPAFMDRRDFRPAMTERE